jgi:hypothetical protein
VSILLGFETLGGMGDYPKSLGPFCPWQSSGQKGKIQQGTRGGQVRAHFTSLTTPSPSLFSLSPHICPSVSHGLRQKEKLEDILPVIGKAVVSASPAMSLSVFGWLWLPPGSPWHWAKNLSSCWRSYCQEIPEQWWLPW